MLTDITLRDTNSSMTYDINSIDELIRELGGPSAVGAWLGISQAAVSNWTAPTRRSIPPGWHWRLAAAARKRGKTVAPAVFDLDDDEATLLNASVA